MKIVYVVSPLGADTKEGIQNNIDKAYGYGEYVKYKGYKPLVVHQLATILDDSSERERLCGLEIDKKILFPLADELWIFDNVISTGMKMEIELAFKNKIPVRFIGELENGFAVNSKDSHRIHMKRFISALKGNIERSVVMVRKILFGIFGASWFFFLCLMASNYPLCYLSKVFIILIMLISVIVIPCYCVIQVFSDY